jgi:hypothetical protein
MLNYLLIPFIPALIFFLKDKNKLRKNILNGLVIANLVFLYTPLFLAVINTPNGESIWNENSGGGTYIWLYYLIIPIYLIVQLILTILKLVFAFKTGRSANL